MIGTAWQKNSHSLSGRVRSHIPQGGMDFTYNSLVKTLPRGTFMELQAARIRGDGHQSQTIRWTQHSLEILATFVYGRLVSDTTGKLQCLTGILLTDLQKEERNRMEEIILTIIDVI